MTIFAAVALYFLDAGVWWWVAYGVYVLSEAATAVYKRRMK
jgi:hypothetical protein